MLDFKGNKENINSVAREHYELKQQGRETVNVRKQLFFLIYNMLGSRKKYMVNGSDVCHTLMVDSALEIFDISDVLEVFNYCLEKWSPGRAEFYVYFMSIYKKRVIDELNKRNMIDNSQDFYYGDDSGVNAIENIEDEFFDSDVQSSVESRVTLTERYTCLNNEILTKKAMYDNSPKFCYETRFYTEYTTSLVSEFGAEKASELIPSISLNIIDRDFAASYLIGCGKPFDADSLDFNSVAKADLRPLSDFTGEKFDCNKKCGYNLRNIVYICYYENVKGKRISEAAVSTKKAEFNNLVESVGLKGI